MSPSERRLLVRVCAALAQRDPEALDQALDRAHPIVSPEAMEEALLQSYLFVGYPVALDALARWRKRRGAPPGERTSGEHWELWSRRGPEVCREVYGNQYEALRRNVRRIHPDMERWMITEGYGKVLGRDGLALLERELCIVAVLAVLRTPNQLYSHLRGALAVGANSDEVEEVLNLAEEYGTPEGAGEARRTWERVLERWARKGTDGRGNE